MGFFEDKIEMFNKLNRCRQEYAQTGHTLFTVGDEGKRIKSFTNSPIRNGVRLICDARCNPISRKFGFSKRKLEFIAQAAVIGCRHIPNLGIESENRRVLKAAGDYLRLFSEYEKNLPGKREYLDEVYGLLLKNTRIALMYFELEAKMCHQHIVRDDIVRTYQVRSVDM